MINTADNKKGKRRSSLARQRIAMIVIAVLCFVLAVTLVAVNIITAQRPYEVEGEEGVKYYIVRQKDEDGNTVYVLTNADKEPLETTEDGYFVTASGALVSIDQTTGLGKIYARPATDGNEQLGNNDRILIFPYTKRAQAQSISVSNGKGDFAFYRRRVYTDTDYASYTCILSEGRYVLIAPEDPEDPESEFVEYKRDADGYYTLKSGNRISVNSRTGAIRAVEYTDFDGKTYSVKKLEGKYVLCDASGNAVSDVITQSGEKHDKDGNAYTDVLYHYYVTEYGTLISVDETYGVLTAWGVREYNPTTKKYSTYHFIKRGDKYVLADGEGELISSTSIDDKDYYSTENNAYLCFNEENGTYKVRIQKNYYLIANNDGVYSLYNKNTLVASNSSGYCALPDGESFVYFDAASGSFSLLRYNGTSYEESQTKYLNGIVETDLDGEFVIEGHEETDYDPSLFAALITNGGYTITPEGGKLSNPERLPDGSIDFAAYGLIECDRVSSTGETYHHVPSYYMLTDLEGNVHKIVIGDKIASNGGFYVRYEGVNTTDEEMESLDKGGAGDSANEFSHQAVYILLDTYSMGFTTSYETFYYYSMSDTFLAPIESIVTPKVVPETSTTTYFDVKNFIISTLNYDKLHEDILEGNDVVDGDYRDVWVNFTYYDIEERRNTVNSSRPYVMGECELYGFNVSDASVNTCLLAMMDLKCKNTQKLSPAYSDLIAYGLDEPEYIIYYELTATGEKPMLFVSKLTVNDTYYVYSSLYDMIVEIDRGMLPFLSWTDNEWLTEDMYDTAIGFIDNVRIENGEWWANFDVEMSQTLETKINTGEPSTFVQKIYCSDDRMSHVLSLTTSINGNTDAPVGTVDVISVSFETLENYYKYIKNGQKLTGMGLNADEVRALEAFVETVSEVNYDEKNGQVVTLHRLSLSDNSGTVHTISLVFTFEASGEIATYMQVNGESSTNVFSRKAYDAYEKIIFSEKTTAAEEALGYGFYNSSYTSASATYNYDKVTGTNSDGTTSIITEHMIERTYKDGKKDVEYFLSTDYRVFFNVDGEDLVGVAHNFVRFYDMSDKDTTTNGAYETIKQFPYEFEATQVRLVVANPNGGTDSIPGGTLGEGKFTVKVTEDMVTVTDEKGNVTRYHRYAGTSIFSGFYATFMYATYEGICEIPEEQKEAFVSSGKSDCKVTFTTKLSPDENGKCLEYVYDTYRYSERRSYITLNGKGDFFVMRTFMDKIVDSSKLVFNNVRVDSADRYN